MVDIDSKLEECDIDFIQMSIQNNGLNIANSIDKLTKELEIANALKILQMIGDRRVLETSRAYKQAKETINEYFGE